MLLSFTHGAGVSRNLAGPFAAVCQIYYEDGGITHNVAPVNVLPHLVTAAFGLALGCVMYSYNMTATLGGSDDLGLLPSGVVVKRGASAVHHLSNLWPAGLSPAAGRHDCSSRQLQQELPSLEACSHRWVPPLQPASGSAAATWVTSSDRQCTCAEPSLAAGVHFAKLTPSRSVAVLLSAAAVRLISIKVHIPDAVMQTVVSLRGAWSMSSVPLVWSPACHVVALLALTEIHCFLCGPGSPHVCMFVA